MWHLSDESGNSEVKSGDVHRSPGIYLTLKESPGNLSWKTVWILWDHSLPQMGSLTSKWDQYYSTPHLEEDGEEKKGVLKPVQIC